jgi:AcrR family transcriptional regulator
MGSSDPLFDTLFRPTTPSPQMASAAPVRAAGTRSRAGNAMNRTRAALLEGARRAVEVNGTKITMAQVATGAGVAKATLYNHFRTREAVLSALLADEVNGLIEGLADRPVADALTQAASSLSENPMLRALARLEPATLAALARVDASAEGWRKAREAVTAVLDRADREGTDMVLRWLASHVMTPAPGAAIAADVDILLTGLPARRTAEQAASA